MKSCKKVVKLFRKVYKARKTGNNDTKQKIRNTYPPLKENPPAHYMCAGGFSMVIPPVLFQIVRS